MLTKQAFWGRWCQVLAAHFDAQWVHDAWTLDCIQSWTLESGVVQAEVACPWPLSGRLWQEGVRACEQEWPDIQWVLERSSAVRARALVGSQQAIPGVKNVIGVISGKGGVGKSTVAANMAKSLAAMGVSVGVMDADVYGPSMPYLFDCADQMVATEGQQFIPHQAHGCAVTSMASLVAPGDALIWRGPMASKAVEQLAYQTRWPALDYLIVDMPPGTGDIAITCIKKIPIQAVLLVSTPHPLARMDVERCVAMARKMAMPILGVVENFAYAHCGHCDEKHFPFGQGLASWCANHNLSLLAQMPLCMEPNDLRECWEGLAMQSVAGLCCLQERRGVNMPPVVAV